jgi:hypothetical protein
MDTETRKRPKPVDFDQLYPGRFIKAGELLGKKVTLTITDVDVEDLIGEDNKPKAKATVSFRETEKQLVLCKTNGISIKAMFGKKLADWVGKRITVFPDTWNGEPCIRIWGSPDIERDMEVEIALPRRRPFKKTMHRVAVGARNGANGRSLSAPPDQAKAIADLRAAQTLAALEAAKQTIWGLYAAANIEVPLEVEDAAIMHAEQLQEQEPAL